MRYVGFLAIGALGAILGLGLAIAATPAAPKKAEPSKIRPLRDVTFERTDARVARGKYLAEGILQCFVCHSERDWTQPGAPPKAGMLGAGQVMRDEPGKRVVAPNLTPDPETGTAAWTDDMFARAIREGIGHDDRPLHQQMWSDSFRRLSEEDIASVVVFIRTLPAVKHELPKTEMDDAYRAKAMAHLKPLETPVAAPQNTPFERGRYLIQLADCGGCHTSWYSKRQPGYFGGGNLIERGERKAYSTNITRDPSGVMLGREGFIELMRTGKNGTMSPLMPWVVFKNLNDDDLDAIRIALSQLPPVSHYVSNLVPPSKCPVCLQEHGMGDRNKVEPVAAKVKLDAAQRAALAGRYKAREDGNIVEVIADGEHLFLGDERQRLEMFAQTPTRFLVPGNLLPVDFQLDEKGVAQRMSEEDLEPYVYDRVVEAAPQKPKAKPAKK